MFGSFSKAITLQVDYRLSWPEMIKGLICLPEDLNPKLFDFDPIPKLENPGMVERAVRLWHIGQKIDPLGVCKEAIEVRRFEIPGPEWVVALGVKFPKIQLEHPTISLLPIERKIGNPGFVVLTTSGPVLDKRPPPKNLCFVHTGKEWNETCRFLIFDPKEAKQSAA